MDRPGVLRLAGPFQLELQMARPALLSVLFLAAVLLAGPVRAETHVTSSGTVDRQKTHRYKFTIKGNDDQKLKATVGCTADRGGARLRIRFYTKSPQGGRRQLTDYRINLTDSQDTTSGTFTLPPGTYEVEVYARHMTYDFKLEDAPEDEEDS